MWDLTFNVILSSALSAFLVVVRLCREAICVNHLESILHVWNVFLMNSSTKNVNIYHGMKSVNCRKGENSRYFCMLVIHRLCTYWSIWQKVWISLLCLELFIFNILVLVLINRVSSGFLKFERRPGNVDRCIRFLTCAIMCHLSTPNCEFQE